jgi:hypothetical protein
MSLKFLPQSAAFTILLSMFFAVSAVPHATAQERSPDLDKQILLTVSGINSAFLSGDMKELVSYMSSDLTMLHGDYRINDLKEAQAEWEQLFALRKTNAMNNYLRVREEKIQIFDNKYIIVTFSYDHPAIIGTKITNESGKAVYVLLRDDKSSMAEIPSFGEKKPIVMVHCSVVIDRADDAAAHPTP